CRGEVDVAESPATPTGDHDAMVGLDKVGDQLAGLGVANDGAGRHLKDEVVALGAMLLLTAAGLAGCGLVMGMVVVVHQSVQAGIGLKVDTAATSTVAAVRPAHRDELFAAEVDGAVAAVASLDVDLRAVEELHRYGSSWVLMGPHRRGSQLPVHSG